MAFAILASCLLAVLLGWGLAGFAVAVKRFRRPPSATGA
jgi:hypothetical protein